MARDQAVGDERRLKTVRAADKEGNAVALPLLLDALLRLDQHAISIDGVFGTIAADVGGSGEVERDARVSRKGFAEEGAATNRLPVSLAQGTESNTLRDRVS